MFILPLMVYLGFLRVTITLCIIVILNCPATMNLLITPLYIPTIKVLAAILLLLLLMAI